MKMPALGLQQVLSLPASWTLCGWKAAESGFEPSSELNFLVGHVFIFRDETWPPLFPAWDLNCIYALAAEAVSLPTITVSITAFVSVE